mgnify:CR=1 FL=1
MTTMAQLRKAATRLPEVEEATRDGRPTFTVAGTRFASLAQDGSVHLRMSAEHADETLARFGQSRRITRSGKTIGVSVELSDVNGMELNSLVHKAWLSAAPRRLVTAQREADRGEAQAGPDALPSSIGKPATRALLGAGVKTLADVATRSEAELLALHGVGPKAVKLLAQALVERGWTFEGGRH